MPLYAGFEYAPLFDHFWICFRATITGDMLFMFTIYIALAVVHRDLFWSANRTYYSHPATWLLPLLIGLLLAVSMELWAVYVDHRWAYAVAMPMVPVVRIGLSPVMQMVMIPIIVLALCRRYAAHGIAVNCAHSVICSASRKSQASGTNHTHTQTLF